MRWLIGLLTLTGSAWAGERLVCPSATASDADKDAYLEAQLAFIGQNANFKIKAAEQIELARCVSSWCSRAITRRQKTIANTQLLQASGSQYVEGRENRAQKVRELQLTLSRCTTPEPNYTRSIVMTAVTVVLASATAYVGFRALSLHKEADELGLAMTPDECGGRAEASCKAHQQSLIDDGNTYQTTAWVLGSAAVVSLGVAIWSAVDPPIDRGRALVTPTIGTHGAGLHVLMEF